ncbi:MAG: carboxymuconolactone decarboxylase family protein [Bacteroidota bacterium]
MATFSVPTLDQITDADARATLEQIQKQIGMIPNLYAFEASSPRTFQTNLAFAHAVEQANFSNREVQAIYLATSEANGCSYCLAAHTALAQMNGFTEAQTFDLRAGTFNDATVGDAPKLGVLTRLTRAFVQTQGRPDDALLDAFFDAGYTQAHFVDLVALISVKTFSNYLHNASDIPVDFPAAKPLPEAVAA